MSDIIYHIPYTYLIKFKPTGQVYYGVRYAKKCHPNDLWSSYFTSSKHIHLLIEEHGKDAFEYEIRKTFNDANAARVWESKVLQRLNVVHSDNWLNKTDNKSVTLPEGFRHSEKTIQKFSRNLKKLHEDKKIGMYGKKQTEYQKQVVSKKMKGVPKDKSAIEKQKKSLRRLFDDPNYVHPNTGRIKSEQTLQLISENHADMSGDKNPMYGKAHLQETIEKMSFRAKNRKRQLCPHCNKNVDSSNYGRWHGDKCKEILNLQ